MLKPLKIHSLENRQLLAMADTVTEGTCDADTLQKSQLWDLLEETGVVAVLPAGTPLTMTDPVIMYRLGDQIIFRDAVYVNMPDASYTFAAQCTLDLIDFTNNDTEASVETNEPEAEESAPANESIEAEEILFSAEFDTIAEDLGDDFDEEAGVAEGEEIL
jgi:hypothetical protein